MNASKADNAIQAYMNANGKMATIKSLYYEAVFLDRSMAALAYTLDQLSERLLIHLDMEDQSVLSFAIDSLRRNREIIRALTPDHAGVDVKLIHCEDREAANE